MSEKRYFGLDVHRQSIMMAAVNAQQEVLLKPRKFAIKRFWEWAEANLRTADVVALEASSDTWYFHDRLKATGATVKVANAAQIEEIAKAHTKTDRNDALILARRLAAKWLPTIWAPPAHVRELRGLVAHRQRLVRDRSAAKNRLCSILRRYQLTAPEGNLFSEANQNWWLNLPISPTDQLRIRHELVHLRHLNQLIKETAAGLARLSTVAPWSEQVVFLVQLPGVGLKSAMAILGAIGTIKRFANSSKLVGYAGLGARVHASGKTYRTGKITKAGRKDLRAVLIECAWNAIQYSDHWKAQYDRFRKRMCSQKAITIIARKLLVVIWHVWSKREVDRQADIQRIARTCMTWATAHRLATSLGLTRLAFVRQQLAKLGLEQPIEQMLFGARVYQLDYCGRETRLNSQLKAVDSAGLWAEARPQTLDLTIHTAHNSTSDDSP